ncbi:MAG: nucleoside kinase [Oscillospiraceae bacterium]|jgi:uridine kinase|nr:nucleoside kinase [Oscillospiraceae bacterium]
MPYPYDIREINERVTKDPKSFALECEAIYNRKVMEAAASIQERISHSNVVFLSGPSGSGKTTTAQKISDSLKKLGIHSHTVSLDKYYLSSNPETTPRTLDGEYDLESPYCLDLELLNDHFTALECGKRVVVPHFCFSTQRRDTSKSFPLKLDKNEIVIFEGIHALNDVLTSEHPDAFKLYISARSDIVYNNIVFFKRTWTRLLRRVVRDDFFRGTDVAVTLNMWANVRDGEKQYISPFKYKADLLFDSSMAYEVPVMKKFAIKAIKEVPEGIRRQEELQSVVPALMEFEELDSNLVPNDSILREFIGGGIYNQ